MVKNYRLYLNLRNHANQCNHRQQRIKFSILKSTLNPRIKKNLEKGLFNLKHLFILLKKHITWIEET